jgi:hypothetical protein
MAFVTFGMGRVTSHISGVSSDTLASEFRVAKSRYFDGDELHVRLSSLSTIPVGHAHV